MQPEGAAGAGAGAGGGGSLRARLEAALGAEREAADALRGAVRGLRGAGREVAGAAAADRAAFERGRAAAVLVKEVARREARAAGDLRCKNAAFKGQAEVLGARLAARDKEFAGLRGDLAEARRVSEEKQGRMVALQGELDGLRAARVLSASPAGEEERCAVPTASASTSTSASAGGRPPLSPAGAPLGRPSPRVGPSRLSPATATRSVKELQNLEKLFSRQWGGQTPVRTSRAAGPPEAFEATPDGPQAPGKCRAT